MANDEPDPTSSPAATAAAEVAAPAAGDPLPSVDSPGRRARRARRARAHRRRARWQRLRHRRVARDRPDLGTSFLCDCRAPASVASHRWRGTVAPRRPTPAGRVAPRWAAPCEHGDARAGRRGDRLHRRARRTPWRDHRPRLDALRAEALRHRDASMPDLLDRLISTTASGGDDDLVVVAARWTLDAVGLAVRSGSPSS